MLTDNPSKEDLEYLSRQFQAIGDRIGEFVVGHRPLIDLISVAVLSQGHVLIEGTPGTAKTIIAKSVAQLMGCKFRRIQGAVDIQPADILGVRIYDQRIKDFVMREGPIFTNFVLMDEMNRLSPKTQSAFIEAMSERQVTIDGITLPLADPFFVIATQNPFESEGTFPIIEAQKDRFMFSYRVTHLADEEELAVIRRASQDDLDWERFSKSLKPLANAAEILRLIGIVKTVRIEPPVHLYIKDLVMATRSHSDVRLGASSRASIALVQSSKVAAALAGRPYVTPDDVKELVVPVLQHRLLLTREAAIEGITPQRVVQEILENVEVR